MYKLSAISIIIPSKQEKLKKKKDIVFPLDNKYGYSKENSRGKSIMREPYQIFKDVIEQE